ncbi:MAG: hypothetical protein ABIK90_03965 [candidate division WOR-3 bacterium]
MKKNKKIATRKELFVAKEKFHKEQARLSFEEKLKILVRLQKMTKNIKRTNKEIIWKIQ